MTNMTENDFYLDQKQMSPQNSEIGTWDTLAMDDLSNVPPPLHLQNELSETMDTFHSTMPSFEGDIYVPRFITEDQHHMQQNLEDGVFSNDHINEPIAACRDNFRHMVTVSGSWESIKLKQKEVPGLKKFHPLSFKEPTSRILDSSLVAAELSIHRSPELDDFSGTKPCSMFQRQNLIDPSNELPFVSKNNHSKKTLHISKSKIPTSVTSNNNQTSEISNPFSLGSERTHYKTTPAIKHTYMNTSQIQPGSQQKIDKPVDAFANLAPFLENITKANYEIFLAEVLKKCQHMTMGDLYNLIYTNKHSDLLSGCARPSIDDTTPTRLRQRDLKVCYRILENLKSSPRSIVSNTGNIRQPSVSLVNFHELFRTFLAMKILSDTIIEVRSTSRIDISLPRASVYKLYYVCCQKLIRKYATFSHSSSVQQSIILAPAKLGKVTRLVFPQLSVKRLGRRGESKSHYMRLKFNEDIVDQETLDLIELDILTIQKYYQDSKGTALNNTAKCSAPQEELSSQTNNEEPIKPREYEHTITEMGTGVYQNPLKTFVDFSSRFPSLDCSPRVWKRSPNLIPQQSKWAAETMYRSLEVLKRSKIDLNPLIQNFNTCIYSDSTQNELSSTVVDALKTLVAASTSRETFLHFYLVIAILLFPVMLASDKEVASPLKSHIRASVRNCIHRITSEIVTPVCVDKLNLETFTGILDKMVKLSEMTSVKVRHSSPEVVLKAIVNDLRYKGRSELINQDSLSSMRQSYMRVVIVAFNAYEFGESSKMPQNTQRNNTVAMSNIAQNFAESVDVFADRIQSISSSGKQVISPDISYQMFSIGMEILHKNTLMNPLIGRLTIPMVKSMMAQISRDMQNFSFHQFRNRDSDISKEVFKTLWIYTTMFQEYLYVLSEVVALSQHLA